MQKTKYPHEVPSLTMKMADVSTKIKFSPAIVGKRRSRRDYDLRLQKKNTLWTKCGGNDPPISRSGSSQPTSMMLPGSTTNASLWNAGLTSFPPSWFMHFARHASYAILTWIRTTLNLKFWKVSCVWYSDI